MRLPNLPIEIPDSERSPLVNWLLDLITSQQQVIENQLETIAKLEEKVRNLDEQLKAAKKLKGQPKIRPSTLNQEEKKPKEGGKRAGSDKRSKKTSFIVDEQRMIEPEELPEGALLQWVSRI
jgi:DNA-binding protein H-NS